MTLEEKLESLEQFTQVLFRQISALEMRVQALTTYDRVTTSDVAQIKDQFEQLEHWHKKMWAVTSSENMLAFLSDEYDAGEPTAPSMRPKLMAFAKLTVEDIDEFLGTFSTDTTYGRRMIDIARDYWINLRPILELAKEHELTKPHVQAIAHKALRKISSHKRIRKIMDRFPDAPAE
jgi:hypothetical protein